MRLYIDAGDYIFQPGSLAVVSGVVAGCRRRERAARAIQSQVTVVSSLVATAQLQASVFRPAREVGFSFCKLPLHQPREAAIPVAIGPTRFEPQRLIIVGDGPREISFGAPYVAANGPGVSRPPTQRRRQRCLLTRQGTEINDFDKLSLKIKALRFLLQG